MIILHNSDDNDNINSNNNMPYRHYIYMFLTRFGQLNLRCYHHNVFGTRLGHMGMIILSHGNCAWVGYDTPSHNPGS